MELIKLENIYLSYGDKKILQGLNFVLYKGEKIGVTGANGAGKTTMIEVIMGFLKPQKGRVLFLGKEINDEMGFYTLRKNIGYVFQDPDDQLFCPTVEEDVAFGPLNLGFSKEDTRKVVENTLKRLNISHLKDSLTYKLSGGEKRMVSIATVLSMNPMGLILDEPINGLDEENTNKVKELLKSLKKPMLIIAHDVNFLCEICARLYELKNGKLQEITTLYPSSQ